MSLRKSNAAQSTHQLARRGRGRTGQGWGGDSETIAGTHRPTRAPNARVLCHPGLPCEGGPAAASRAPGPALAGAGARAQGWAGARPGRPQPRARPRRHRAHAAATRTKCRWRADAALKAPSSGSVTRNPVLHTRQILGAPRPGARLTRGGRAEPGARQTQRPLCTSEREGPATLLL